MKARSKQSSSAGHALLHSPIHKSLPLPSTPPPVPSFYLDGPIGRAEPEPTADLSPLLSLLSLLTLTIFTSPLSFYSHPHSHSLSHPPSTRLTPHPHTRSLPSSLSTLSHHFPFASTRTRNRCSFLAVPSRPSLTRGTGGGARWRGDTPASSLASLPPPLPPSVTYYLPHLLTHYLPHLLTISLSLSFIHSLSLHLPHSYFHSLIVSLFSPTVSLSFSLLHYLLPSLTNCTPPSVSPFFLLFHHPMLSFLSLSS